MKYEDAIKIIEQEGLSNYKRISFDGKNIMENQIGIRDINNGWEVYCTSEKGGIDVIETYKLREDAISNMIEGLRVEKRLAERLKKR